MEVVDGEVVLVSVIKELSGRSGVEVTSNQHKFLKNSLYLFYAKKLCVSNRKKKYECPTYMS